MGALPPGEAAATLPRMVDHILIGDTTPRIAYTAIAAQTVFVVPFAFFDNADLEVYVSGVLKTITTDYTASGSGSSTGGQVTFVTPLVGGEAVVIVRDIVIERTTDFPGSGPFVIDDLNGELDRIVAIEQQLQDEIDRTLRLADSDTTGNIDIPAAAARANKFLAFDANGDVVMATTVTGATVSAFMATVLDDADAATARATLGVATFDTGIALFNHQNFI